MHGDDVMRARVMISVNAAWNLWNFRSSLIRAMIDAGYEVLAVAPSDEYAERLESLGCRFIHLSMDNKGTHPIRDATLFLRYCQIMYSQRPDVYLGFTVKPNVYGSLAAHLLGVQVINNIAGLGVAFNHGGWLNRLVRWLYKVALWRSRRVFFQNAEDLDIFVSDGLVAKSVCDRLPGSGVDLSRFAVSPLPSGPKVRFLLVARMLWEKGVGEFVEAARRLKSKGVHAEFCLLGFVDVQNPAAISRSQMDAWVAEGVIRYLGVSDDVPQIIRDADCVVLPSYYREGTPRSLLEAAAMGRPIITSDSVGCRDVVDHGVNGYLCRPRDAEDLADKLTRIVNMTAMERTAMGLRGREKMAGQFDERLVLAKYLSELRSINDV
jgi:glycosyltransferase involved in cell wall biosynthesis